MRVSDWVHSLTCKELAVVFIPKYVAPKLPLSAGINQLILEPHVYFGLAVWFHSL